MKRPSVETCKKLGFLEYISQSLRFRSKRASLKWQLVSFINIIFDDVVFECLFEISAHIQLEVHSKNNQTAKFIENDTVIFIYTIGWIVLVLVCYRYWKTHGSTISLNKCICSKKKFIKLKCCLNNCSPR